MTSAPVECGDLVYQFDYADDPERIIVDIAQVPVWDASSVAALDAITTKYAARAARLSKSAA